MTADLIDLLPPAEGRGMTRVQLLEAIESRILSGELPAGAPLPSERRLSEHLGVSRPVVREVFSTLAARNLVEVELGRGAFIRGPRISDAAQSLGLIARRQEVTPRSLLEARGIVEVQAAGLAAERRTDADLERLTAALESFDASRTVLERVRHDLAFHAAMVRAAHNSVLTVMFGSISLMSAELMLRSLTDPGVTDEGAPLHHDILDAVRRGHADAARHAAGAHLEVGYRHYGDDLDARLDHVARRELEAMFGSQGTLDRLLEAVDEVGTPDLDTGADGDERQGEASR